MEVKKSEKAQLESKRSTRFLAGITAVLAIIFVSFEWNTYDKDMGVSSVIPPEVPEVELIPVSYERPKPPPPPIKTVDVFEIVKDDKPVVEVETVSSEDIGQPLPTTPTALIIEDKEVVEESEPFIIVEEMPTFENLNRYLSKNINYPTISAEQGHEGKVIVQFVVNKDGSIVDAVVLRGVDPYMDKEALRVVNSMPKWKPGMQRGEPVRVRFTLPVVFKLQK